MTTVLTYIGEFGACYAALWVAGELVDLTLRR
jgi:hypothetical protein